ncbi:MAG: ArsR/SmtB family transcription factor [Thermoguttaceae bacterium]
MKKATKSETLSVEQKAEIFKALAHPTRLRIVEKLGEGEQCVCVLLEMFEIDFSTISRHLSVLKNAGVVVCDKRGKNVYYSLTCPCLIQFLNCFDTVLSDKT